MGIGAPSVSVPSALVASIRSNTSSYPHYTAPHHNTQRGGTAKPKVVDESKQKVVVTKSSRGGKKVVTHVVS